MVTHSANFVIHNHAGAVVGNQGNIRDPANGELKSKPPSFCNDFAGDCKQESCSSL